MAVRESASVGRAPFITAGPLAVEQAHEQDPAPAGPLRYLDTAALAARVGLSPDTIRTYRRRTPHLVPEPDVMVGEFAGWLPETVDAWLAQRPGPGVGGGRPRKGALRLTCVFCGHRATPRRDPTDGGAYSCRGCAEPMECQECGQTLGARRSAPLPRPGRLTRRSAPPRPSR